MTYSKTGMYFMGNYRFLFICFYYFLFPSKFKNVCLGCLLGFSLQSMVTPIIIIIYDYLGLN